MGGGGPDDGSLPLTLEYNKLGDWGSFHFIKTALPGFDLLDLR